MHKPIATALALAAVLAALGTGLAAAQDGQNGPRKKPVAVKPLPAPPKTQDTNNNGPKPVAPVVAPKPVEGVDEAEALNARVNAANAAAEARDRARDAEFERRQAEYEAKKRADAAAYAKAQADYERQKAAVEAQRQRDLADWQARVAACKAGDTSQCAK